MFTSPRPLLTAAQISDLNVEYHQNLRDLNSGLGDYTLDLATIQARAAKTHRSLVRLHVAMDDRREANGYERQYGPYDEATMAV